MPTPLAGTINDCVNLHAAVSSGFAPSGEMLAVVEEQVVVLFAKSAHGSAKGDSCGRRIGVLRHAYHLSLAEICEGAAQNFAPFQIMGDGAVSKVDAVVVKQAMPTWDL